MFVRFYVGYYVKSLGTGLYLGVYIYTYIYQEITLFMAFIEHASREMFEIIFNVKHMLYISNFNTYFGHLKNEHQNKNKKVNSSHFCDSLYKLLPVKVKQELAIEQNKRIQTQISRPSST